MRSYFLLVITLFFGCNSTTYNFTHKEPYRPQIHFTPQDQWMNDPNGLFYYEGEYHLFYQYNPYGNTWGHMSWGHAVSTDLIHWKHLPVALKEENGIMIFSGSAVVDWHNSSGFGTKNSPPIVAIYTGYHEATGLQEQSISYSTDKGRTWTKYSENPVLDLDLNNFRDPKVFWYSADQKWVMVVAMPMDRKVQFYSSSDLKSWSLMSDFGPIGSVRGQWECPDLFPIKTNTGEEQWILQIDIDSGAISGGSGSQYFVGFFDGTNFSLDPSMEATPPYIPLGITIEDFEGNLDQWQRTGNAFSESPVTGNSLGQKPITGYFNKKFLNSYFKGNESVGTATSKLFTINKSYLNFLIGGGNHSDLTIQLIVEGQVVKTSSAHSNTLLEWESWEVSKFSGKQAQIRITDQNTDQWGYIAIDHIHLSNIPAYNVVQQAKWVDYGKDFYALVSWNDIPQQDERRIWLSWMNNWQYGQNIPTGKWRSSMSFPRTVALLKQDKGYQLQQQFAEELQNILKPKINLTNTTTDSVNSALNKIKHPKNAFYSTLKWSAEYNLSVVLQNDNTIAALKLEYFAESNKLRVTRPEDGNVTFHKDFPYVQEVYLDPLSQTIDMQILVDASSVEVLAQDGTISITNQIFPHTALNYQVEAERSTTIDAFEYAEF